MRRLPERPRGRRLCVALLRWMLPVAFLLPGLTHRAPEAPPVATSSGTHAWWVRAGEGGWQLVHGVADATGATTTVAIASSAIARSEESADQRRQAGSRGIDGISAPTRGRGGTDRVRPG